MISASLSVRLPLYLRVEFLKRRSRIKSTTTIAIRRGERIENYIDFDKVEELSHQIERRKELEAELKALKLSLPAPKRVLQEEREYPRVQDLCSYR